MNKKIYMMLMYHQNNFKTYNKINYNKFKNNKILNNSAYIKILRKKIQKKIFCLYIKVVEYSQYNKK